MSYQTLKELALQTSSATILDVMKPRANQPYIKETFPLTEGTLFGKALTVQLMPAREDIIQKSEAENNGNNPLIEAMKLADEETVMVVATNHHHDIAIGWDNKFAYFNTKNPAWLITDGALRDTADFKNVFSFPVYINRPTPLAGTGRAVYPRYINHDVSIGGAVVAPWDYIFGDEDAVVVIPWHMIEDILLKAVAREKKNIYLQKLTLEKKVPYTEILADFPNWKDDLFEWAGNLTEEQKEYLYPTK